MSQGSRLSRGDKRRNHRLTRYRGIVRRDHAVVAIDLASKKQVVAVVDHDSRILARRTFRCAPTQLATAIEWSTTNRSGWHLLIAEAVATAGLIVVIFALARSGRSHLAAPTVGAYIGAAYFFTSSTSFANPAITIGRMFSDTFAGIAPTSALPFIGAQFVGAAIGWALVRSLFPLPSPEPAAPRG